MRVFDKPRDMLSARLNVIATCTFFSDLSRRGRKDFSGAIARKRIFVALLRAATECTLAIKRLRDRWRGRNPERLRLLGTEGSRRRDLVDDPHTQRRNLYGNDASTLDAGIYETPLLSASASIEPSRCSPSAHSA